MTTDEATESQHQKKPSQQEAEQHQATPPDHGPSESQAATSPATSPQSTGSPSYSSPQEEVQLRPRRRTSAGRGLSRLFSSFLKRRSQCEEDGGEKGEKGGDGEEPKAPIADCEPELKIEGDQNLDLHSLSSNEAQLVQVDQKEDPEKDSEEEGGETDKEKREEDSAQGKEKEEEEPEGEGEKEGVEKTTEEDAQPPKPPRRPRIMQIKVTLLDDTLFECELEKHAKGVELFTKVCDHLNLLERDYYGLAIWESPSMKTWMDFTKEIRRQVQGAKLDKICADAQSCTGTNYDFTFNVKFYPPDPAQLSEDITRYYLCLQLRKDILGGRLPCSFVTLALLGSYALQSELGEYDPETHAPDYAKDLRLAPGQTKELEKKVMELHKTYRSMSPAQADMAFLENAKKLAMYGVDLHQAKDLDGVDIMLGVCSGGLMVYKDKLRINRFPWPKVLKVSYKRSSFFIKIRPSELEHYESAIGFKLPNYKASKKLWKVCVEHHTFFRLTSTEVATTPRKFLALGSKFRYSGRTQAQTRQASSMIDRPAPLFQRSASKRNSRSLDEAMVSTPDKSTRPVSAPIMSPVSPGDAAPPTVTSALPRSERREASTAPGRQSRSAERKTKEEAKVESKVTEVSKTQSSRPQSTPEFKREGARRSRHHAPAVTTTTTNGTERERKSQHSPRDRTGTETVRVKKKRAKKLEGQTIYIRHSNIMLEDLDKTHTEIMRHHTSISELKRSFMESVPEPRQSEWDKRLSTHSPFRTASINGQLQSGTDGSNVVKTQTITISDVSNSLRGDVYNKEVPIMHTETKTITYESAQCLLQPVDSMAERDSGMLLSAQTITSETVSTTTTTQITKTVKGGISETRIEKRIVITGDTEIDHDKALAQAIKEAKEQHPDMSVTKVVVHQETEITPD
ncbi:protein 4.1-like isoform X1 [Oncorhynchus tshawytscha]|uniref:protein 4.1-like isoform X1 n=1 Tax=Oncorhynchus tshawytscha TaxID=74940 RepID=UPI001C3C2220|nr:protein 4.1-like isoform X1 [Oncorhynchus tshawytscha]XP_042151067.1 protein 4.1-like isoform X1 [Oncorhynchus tshawytscha]